MFAGGSYYDMVEQEKELASKECVTSEAVEVEEGEAEES